MGESSMTTTVDKYAARESRNDAKFFADTVRYRAGGKCEVCHFDCVWIGEIHHIRPVRSGGGGYPENLVHLCPNCHKVVEKLNTRYCENPHFEAWIRHTYQPDVAQRLIDLAYGVADFLGAS